MAQITVSTYLGTSRYERSSTLFWTEMPLFRTKKTVKTQRSGLMPFICTKGRVSSCPTARVRSVAVPDAPPVWGLDRENHTFRSSDPPKSGGWVEQISNYLSRAFGRVLLPSNSPLGAHSRADKLKMKMVLRDRVVCAPETRCRFYISS